MQSVPQSRSSTEKIKKRHAINMMKKCNAADKIKKE